MVIHSELAWGNKQTTIMHIAAVQDGMILTIILLTDIFIHNPVMNKFIIIPVNRTKERAV